MAGEHGRLRQALHRVTAGREELEAADLRSSVATCGATAVADCVDRERVTVAGVLRTVTLRPRAGTPTLEAELYDGSGTVALVWLGRRRIAGIEPGRHVVATGRLARADGRRVLYNPEYDLQA